MKFERTQYGEKVIFTRAEQEYQFAQNIKDVLENTRYFLDNLDFFPVFQANWINYSTGKGQPKWKKNPLYQKEFCFKSDNYYFKEFNQTSWLNNGDTRGNYDYVTSFDDFDLLRDKFNRKIDYIKE